MPRVETLGQRIRRLRHDRGMSLAKVSGGDFSRAFLNQVELGRSQPSTRVLRVIAGRLGTEVDYLLEGRLPGDRARAGPREGARPAGPRRRPPRARRARHRRSSRSTGRSAPTRGSARPRRLLMLGRNDEAAEVLDSGEAGDRGSAATPTACSACARSSEARRCSIGGGDLESAAQAHLRLADRAQRAANSHDALEHYRAARVLLEVRAPTVEGERRRWGHRRRRDLERDHLVRLEDDRVRDRPCRAAAPCRRSGRRRRPASGRRVRVKVDTWVASSGSGVPFDDLPRP